METPLLTDQECLSSSEDDAQSYMDEDDVREVRLYHWLSETAGARFMQDSSLTRADSPLLGDDHFLTRPHDLESTKALPDLPPAISRLRSQSNVSFTTTPNIIPSFPSTTLLRHRHSPSHSLHSIHSHSPAPSRRPSLARKPSLANLDESAPLPISVTPVTPPPRRSSRMHSISSSISLLSNRNIVCIDSEEVSSRLDRWLTMGPPEMRHDEENQDPSEYYATNFGGFHDSFAQSSHTPSSSYSQGPPPNTPMTAYYNTPHASSSQIYLGKYAASGHQTDEVQKAPVGGTNSEQEDVRATPVPHGRLVGPDLAVSCSTSSESSQNSPVFSAATLSTVPTSPGLSSCSIAPSRSSPMSLASKPSLPSISMGVLSPKPSLTSIGFAYQKHVPDTSNANTLTLPLAATASRWSLTSSVAGDVEKDRKKKEKGATRKRLASFISKISGNATTKDSKEAAVALSPTLGPVRTRERSCTDASLPETRMLLPPVKIKSRSKPPSLKLGSLANSHSVSNLRSPTLSSQPSLSSLSAHFSPTKSSMTSSTPTPTFPPSVVASPVSACFTPASPTKKSFASSARLSVSTCMTTTSTNTASPLLPNTPILNDAPLASPALKNAVSVPALSPAWEGPGLLRRDNSYGWNLNTAYFGESAPTSPMSNRFGDEEAEDLEDDAEYYVRDFAVAQKDAALEEERKTRLSLITDMLDRDLKTPQQQPKHDKAPVPVPVPTPTVTNRDSVVHISKEIVKPNASEVPVHSTPVSPTHFRKSSSGSRSSYFSQSRSVSGPGPVISKTTITPPVPPAKTGFRNLAARIGISNSLSTPQSPPSPGTESKSKSLANLMANNKRKDQKRRLVIRGVGDEQGNVEALKEWCASLGEVRSMVKVKSVDGVVTQIRQNQGGGHDVWVVDFKKSSVAESVCRLQAKVEIKGAGSVHLSWETAKPKLRFNVAAKMGWIP